MNTINSILSRIADWVLAPLAAWPLATLIVVSVVTGVMMAVIFRYTSNQAALGQVVDRSKGHLLAIKLFKDDLPGMFSSLGHVLGNVGFRLWYSVVPMLVMIIPLLFLLTQLALRYEYRPLSLGESAVVQLQLKDEAWPSFQNAKITAPDGVDVETDALRDGEEHSLYWRIRPTADVAEPLRWKMGTDPVEKQVAAAEDTQDLRAVSYRRPGTQWWDRLLYPGEPGFDEKLPVESIVVHYPRRETPILGFNIPWWLTFFVVSIIAALLMQPIVKVRF